MIDDCKSCMHDNGNFDEYPCDECSISIDFENHFEHVERYCEQKGCKRFGLKLTDGYCRARCDDCKNELGCSDAIKMNNTYTNMCDRWIKAE